MATSSEYVSPLENFLVNTSKTDVNDASFILSIWINGCHSKYPTNVASMEHIHKYYISDRNKMKQLIVHDFPSQIIKILKENNNKFKLLCNGYIRQLNTKYIIPNDVIDIINKTCIIKYFDDLQTAALNILTNIFTSKVLNTKQINDLYDNGVVDILMKSTHKTTFLIISRIAWTLTHIAQHLKKRNVISIYDNHISKCIKVIRMHFSEQNSVPIPPLEELIHSNIVSLLRMLFNQTTYPILQYESLWSILNITACDSEYIKYITSNNKLVKTLISLLKTSNYEIKEQALWALGNIAGDGIELRDMLLTNNILKNILSICNSKFDEKYVTNFTNIRNRKSKWLFFNLLSICSWTVFNLCRGSATSSPPTVGHLYDLIKCLQCLFQQALLIDDNIRGGYRGFHDNGKDIGTKNEIIRNIAWSFTYLTGCYEFHNDLINRLDELDIIKQFVNLMCHKYAEIRHPINRVIGNILTGSDEYARKCLDLGILSKYSYLLTSINNISDREQREICWALSNVCATNAIRDKLLVVKNGLFGVLINSVQNGKYEVAKEALWAIRNSTLQCDATIINHLIENGIHTALMAFLEKYPHAAFTKTKRKNKILLIVFELIENILIVGQRDNMNEYLNLFEECGIGKFLTEVKTDEEITKDMNATVHEKCVDIINKYFHTE